MNYALYMQGNHCDYCCLILGNQLHGEINLNTFGTKINLFKL